MVRRRGGGGDNATPLQRGIRNEFWRHFNAEFDRAATRAQDPDADSLLNIGEDDLPPEPLGVADITVSRHARDDMRRQIQTEFWNEYARSLDDKMRPDFSDPRYLLSGSEPYAPAGLPLSPATAATGAPLLLQPRGRPPAIPDGCRSGLL